MKITVTGRLKAAGHCECHTGYYGSSCGFKLCPSDLNGHICASQGTCNEHTGSCVCFDGFSGVPCDTAAACPTSALYPAEPCAGHGKCAAGVCSCGSEWHGVACDTQCPLGDGIKPVAVRASLEVAIWLPGKVCSAGGSCDRASGNCLCFQGRFGVSCELHECPSAAHQWNGASVEPTQDRPPLNIGHVSCDGQYTQTTANSI